MSQVFPRIIVTAAIVLASVACGRQDEPVDTTLETRNGSARLGANGRADTVGSASAESVRRLTGSEQLTVAFQAAFGKADSATKTIEGDRLTYAPTRLLWIGDVAALVSTAKNKEDCHACAGAISVHYLRPAGARFEVTNSWMRAAGGGDWGNAADKFTVSHEFSRYPVIVTESSGGGQGLFCGFAEIVELRPEGPIRWEKVPNLYSDVGNKGEEEGIEIKGRIANVKKDVSFDVLYSGNDSFTEHYRRRGNKFVRTSAGSNLPSC